MYCSCNTVVYLQDWRLSEQKAVGDVVAEHERGDKMVHWAGLAAVRTQHERVHPAHATELIQRAQVGVHVVHVVSVWRVVVFGRPILSGGKDVVVVVIFVVVLLSCCC